MGRIERIRESSIKDAPNSNDVVYPVTVTDATYTKARDKLSKYVITDIEAQKVNKATKITFTSEDSTQKEVTVEDSDPEALSYYDINSIIYDVFGF